MSSNRDESLQAGTHTATTTIGSDSPAWSQTGDSWTRYATGPDGALARQITGTSTGPGTEPTSAEMMLVNPHGDITATIPNTPNVTANQLSALTINDEYGQPLTPDQPQPYQWLGAAQRSNNGQAGIILMGARQYNPATGRFLTLDPVPGGNPNPYTYPVDPVNNEDLTGLWAWVVPVVVWVARVVANVAPKVWRWAAPLVPRAWNWARSLFTGSTSRTTVETLTKSERRAIRSLEKRIDEHREKLEAYKRDPWAHDDGRLANAASADIQRKIIRGRKRHLCEKIAEFQRQVDRIREGS